MTCRRSRNIDQLLAVSARSEQDAKGVLAQRGHTDAGGNWIITKWDHHRC